jgi:cell division transport system permease protein
MPRASTVRYFFGEAVRDLRDRRLAAVLSIATITASLALTGLFVTLGRGAAATLAAWRSQLGVSVFLGENAGDAERSAIRSRIAASEATASFEYLSREEAAEKFRREFPDLADLPGFFAESPFPASFEIRLRPEAASAQGASDFATELKSLAGVADVRYDAAWFEQVRGLLRAAGAAGAFLGVVLAAAAIVASSSVVRLGMAARSDEIEFLRLVGAEPAFIRAPFLIEGALQGGAGGLLAVAAVAGALAMLARAGQGASLAVAIAGGNAFPFGPLSAAAIVVCGVLLGLAGAGFASAAGSRGFPRISSESP